MKIYMQFESEGKIRNGKWVTTSAKTDHGLIDAAKRAYSGTPASLCGYQLDAVIIAGRRIDI